MNDPTASKADMSETLNLIKTVAIPGYLQVELDNSIAFPANMKVSGKGGTAQVIKCKLKDPNLIEKHGIVDVVVKIFGKETSKESFLYEVMIMSRLPKSPNLIELIGYNDDRRILAIIMKGVYAREASWKDLSLDQIDRLAMAGERPEMPLEKVIEVMIEDLIKLCWSQEPRERPSYREVPEKS